MSVDPTSDVAVEPTAEQIAFILSAQTPAWRRRYRAWLCRFRQRKARP